jgi:hypothetical protein
MLLQSIAKTYSILISKRISICMIYKIIAVLTLILIALPANAKQMKFIGVQDCGPVKQITQNTVVNWGEKPLIRAQGVQFGPEGTKYESAMMYFVNQDTGTWSLIALYPDSVACVIAAGTKFTPYSQ